MTLALAAIAAAATTFVAFLALRWYLPIFRSDAPSAHDPARPRISLAMVGILLAASLTAVSTVGVAPAANAATPTAVGNTQGL